MKKNLLLLQMIFFLCFSCLIIGCVTPSHPQKDIDKSSIEKPTVLPLEEQEELAMNTLYDMLELTAERPRQEVIPEIISGYEKIIREAPDTLMAEESHFMLIVNYFENPTSPQVEKAEETYRKYFERYENPRYGRTINDTMARLYYNYKMWDRLSVFLIPFIKKYVETGKIHNALYLLYYSEARYQLKDYDEAVRGFRMLIRENPQEMELNFARKRLEQAIQLSEESKKKEQ